jgi:hypothetical protein
MSKLRSLVPPMMIPVLAAACCCGPPTQPPLDVGIVTFVFDGRPGDTMRVIVDHAPTLAAARRAVSDPRAARIPIGPILRGAGTDPRWPFHFDPLEIRIADAAMELCDGAPMRTAGEVDAFLAGTGNADAERTTWCPWGARPIAVH